MTGCTVGPDFKRPAPEAPAAWNATPSKVQTSQIVTSAPADAQTWWTRFNDPEL
jgi:multidrug efflux system outer membrane protein